MKRLSSLLIYAGGALVILSLIFLIVVFAPIIKLELSYFFQGPGKEKVVLENKTRAENVLVPVDPEFGIVIPKIRANAKIIPNVNPYSEPEYQRALARGVAQARGTGVPGEGKNIFLFSHSSVDFLEASRYNSIFYLLNKMEKGDEIDLFYKGREYKYKVTDKKIVDPKNVAYLSPNSNQEKLTLMTCWPPGTNLQRLIITARQ